LACSCSTIGTFQRLIPKRSSLPAGGSPGRLNRAVIAGLTAFILILSAARLTETFHGELPEPLRFLARVAAPFQVVNSYGLFSIMTTTRPEIIVEGSNDGETWLAYEFRYKPGDLNRPPRWPRRTSHVWTGRCGLRHSAITNPTLVRGLRGAFARKLPPVLALLEKNPFPNYPPRFVRAMVYEYSSPIGRPGAGPEPGGSGTPLGVYLPAISLRPGAQ